MNRRSLAPEEVQPIRQAIAEAWKDIPLPDWSDFMMDDRETRRERDYYCQRRVEDVDLDHPYAVDELPLSYFTPSAAAYYLKAFLEYLLNINSWQGGSPSIEVIDYLCSKRRRQRKLSLAQIDCIVAVLSMVKRYPEFYYQSDKNERYLGKALSKWRSLATSLRESGTQVFEGKI
jgi:hypothetical protein